MRNTLYYSVLFLFIYLSNFCNLSAQINPESITKKLLDYLNFKNRNTVEQLRNNYSIASDIRNYKKQHGIDKHYLDMLISFTRVLVDVQPIESLKYTDSIIFYSRQIHEKLYEINSMHIKGYIFSKMGKSQRATEIFLHTTKLFKEYQSWTAYGFAEIDLGNAYFSEKMYNLATFHYEYAYQAFLIEKNDVVDLGRALVESNKGLIFIELKQYPEALLAFKRALKIREDIKNEYLVSHTLRNMAELYIKQNKTDSALFFYNLALTICNKMNAKIDISEIYMSLSDLFFQKQDFHQAIYFARKSLNNSQQNNTEENFIETFLTIGKYYKEMEKPDSSILYFEEAYKKSESLNMTSQQRKACENLVALFKGSNDTKKLVFYLENLTKLQLINNKEQLLKKQLDYELNQYQTDSFIYETNVSRQRNIILIIAISLVISISLTFLLVMLQKKLRKNSEILKNQNIEIRQKSNELQEKNKKLIELDEYKQKLTAIMVHDLKNPLSAIIGFAQLKEITREKQIILHAAYEMMNQIMNILYIQKFNEETIQANFKICKIAEIFQSVFYQMQYSFKISELTFTYNENTTFTVFCDSILIERVLINLLSNAVKFCSKKGIIELDVFENEENIKISVVDNGVGISEENQKKLFTSSNQISTNEDGKHATRFGLAFCKKAVSLHGGQIGVNSQERVGTEIWFTLPKL